MAVLDYLDLTPTIASDCFIAPNAIVMGDVTIGALSSIWYHSVIRGDVCSITIGDGTNIQDLSVVHVSGPDLKTKIGDRVTVGHRAIIHACTIGDETMVGMGSIILDEAVIGSHCLIGAGAVVTPRKVIPDRSVVLGNPGRIVRQVTDEEIVWFQTSAKHYIEAAKNHALSIAKQSLL